MYDVIISCHGNAKSAETCAMFELSWLITRKLRGQSFCF